MSETQTVNRLKRSQLQALATQTVDYLKTCGIYDELRVCLLQNMEANRDFSLICDEFKRETSSLLKKSADLNAPRATIRQLLDKRNANSRASELVERLAHKEANAARCRLKSVFEMHARAFLNDTDSPKLVPIDDGNEHAPASASSGVNESSSSSQISTATSGSSSSSASSASASSNSSSNTLTSSDNSSSASASSRSSSGADSGASYLHYQRRRWLASNNRRVPNNNSRHHRQNQNQSQGQNHSKHTTCGRNLNGRRRRGR